MATTRLGSAVTAVVMWFALGALGARAQHGPVIERIEPTSGPAGTSLQIVGRGFIAGASARIGDVELTVERVSPSRIVASVGTEAVTGVVSVRTSVGSMRGPQFRVTAAVPAPTVSAFAPAAGPPGTEVVIRGSGFGVGLARTQVSLAGQPLVVRSASPSELRVLVPDGAQSGVFDVSVREAGSVRSEASFSITARTEIQSVVPRGAAPGSLVTVTGTGFSTDAANNRVYLKNARCTVESATDTVLQVRIPARAETGRLLVDVRGAGRFESPGELIVQRPPTLASATPARALVGAKITLVGTNFGTDASAIKVRLGELELPVLELSRMQAVVELPQNAATGAISLTVHDVGPAVLKAPFEVLEPLALRAFEPMSGPAGTIVTLTGAGFSPTRGDNRVRVAGRAFNVLEATSNELRVRVTPGSSGPIEVAVAGSGAVSTSDPYVVTTPPIITGFSPSRGVVGTEVTIRGQRFGTDALAVTATLSDKPLEIVSVREDLLVVRIGPGMQSGALAVGTALQGTTTLKSSFLVVASLVVLRAVPARARAGAMIDVRGNGFSAGAVVVLGESVIEPESITPERIRFKLPSGIAGGLLTVRLRDGREATGPRPFTPIP